jgi:hypothetical protein
MTFGKASRLILAVAGMAANFAPATVIESFDCAQGSMKVMIGQPGRPDFVVDNDNFAQLECVNVPTEQIKIFGRAVCKGVWDTVPPQNVVLSIKTVHVENNPLGISDYTLVSVTRPVTGQSIIFDSNTTPTAPYQMIYKCK